MSPRNNPTAVLGPTNTGKTHLAVERMLASPTGMIGLPLRLLAREIFDRVRARVGDHAVALVTGEEKIIPAQPRFWVATVEAMPSDVDVSFLAIDEVQLAADLDRGHVFTDRILHRRGRDETMLLGAATMRGALEQLLPGTNFITRPRFSKLSYAGQKKLTRLPRRSAIVGFSAETVYAIAEAVRRQRGGAAVVLGALSPRTRNAQVALYQSGDVDYLVATDAIGMGLNMDVDHVAFAQTRKFDGFTFRNLNAAELGQIAGRAGRHMNDGTFGVTAEADPLEQELVQRLEDHRFEPVRVLQWRNRDLDVSSLESLRASLAQMPRQLGLTRAQPAPDLVALETLSADPDVARLADGPEAVARLWEVCQIPDYRNISSAEHASMVARIFRFRSAGEGRIPEDWFERQLGYCNRTEGGIDTLSARIAHVRTWTFVANRADWLADPLHWQGRAREIEDRLSDALHERLTQRFIDRRTSVLMRRLREKEDIMSTVEEDGAIQVEGELIGHIRGFVFTPAASSGSEDKTLKAAWLKTVAQEIQLRAQAVAVSPDTDLKLTGTGRIVWQGADVGRLVAGATTLKPRVAVIAPDQLEGAEKEAVQARLEKFVQRQIGAQLDPLVKLSEAEELTGIARGIAFRLVEQLGVIDRETVAEDLKSLSQADRALLRKHGVRFGSLHVFMPDLLKPKPTELRLLLWSLGSEREPGPGPDGLVAAPGQGLTSTSANPAAPQGFYRVAGYRECGARAVRIDMLERLADLIRPRVFWKPQKEGDTRPRGSVPGGGFTVIPDMMSLVGCAGEDFAAILRALGFRAEKRQGPLPEPEAPAPKAEAAPVVEAAEGPPTPTDADAAPVETASQTPEAEALSVVTETPVVEAVQEAVPALETEAAPSEAPAAPAETPVAAAESAAPVEPVAQVAEAPAEPQLVDVWWPDNTGPFRRRSKPEFRQRSEKREQGRQGDGAQRRDRRPRRDRAGDGNASQQPRDGARTEPAAEDGERQARQRRPDRDRRPERKGDRKPENFKPRREKEPDADSPFAVLQALKAQLSRKS
ncbi:MAG: helicase-related protein [Parvibaculaceae bacterium]